MLEKWLIYFIEAKINFVTLEDDWCILLFYIIYKKGMY